MDNIIKYHLEELEIARNPRDNRRSMPDFGSEDKAILDIGCGIGQLFVASDAGSDILQVGIDISFRSLQYGARNYPNISYVSSSADSLPFGDSTFDLVVSRVSLPYTNIPVTFNEIARVLKPRGRIWITFHSMTMQRRQLIGAMRKFDFKNALGRGLVILNGLYLHLFGKNFALPGTKKYESCQTSGSMRRLLADRGFTGIEIEREKCFLVTATYPGADSSTLDE